MIKIFRLCFDFIIFYTSAALLSFLVVLLLPSGEIYRNSKDNVF